MTTNKHKDSWIVLLACTLLAICIVGLAFFVTSTREEIKARTTATVQEEEESFESFGSCHDLSLTLQAATISIPNTNDLRISTRLFNGQYPGPTLRLQAGECYRVAFHNALEDDAPNDANAHIAVRHVNNQLSAPNETNLHFHGLHITGTIPSDDVVRVVVRPGGESYTYTIRVPTQHMGGTHWLHAHRHGSSALQVGGGAVAAVIVEDPPGTLPVVIQQAPQVLFVAHAIDIPGMTDVATKTMHDALWHVAGNAASAQSSTWITVNGQVQPQLELQAGVWTRIRVVWAAWRKGNLDWQIVNQGNDGDDNDACQVALLAKDGIYIRDFPRWVSVLPLLPGARADVMVRCLQPNQSHVVTAKGGLPIATLRTVATTSNPPALEAWTPAYPDYLQDLRATPASPHCTCTTDLTQARRQINGFLYQPDAVLHQSYLGAVVERHLITGTHPYHQHVYPFQLINDVVVSSSGQGKNNVNEDDNNDDVFYRAGDWHDTIQQAVGQADAIVVRYGPMHFSGQVMVHCHRLKHEDEGMMATELVHADDRRGCTCTSWSSFSAATSKSSASGWLWFVFLATWPAMLW